MSGQTLERFVGRTVEVEHTLDWRDTTFTATLADYDRDFLTFQFADGELIAVKKSRILWLSDDPGPGSEPGLDPEPQPAELDLEVWNVCNVQ